MVILVHRLLDREQKVGSALDLIDDGSVEPANEAYRVGLRRVERRLIVERV